MNENQKVVNPSPMDECVSEYKFIHFVLLEKKKKTGIWSCRNNRNGEQLGTVEWYGAWRQYCFAPSTYTIYSKGCLDDISHFISRLR